MGALRDYACLDGAQVEVSMQIVSGEYRSPRSKVLSCRVQFREMHPIRHPVRHMGDTVVHHHTRWFSDIQKAREHFHACLPAMHARYLILYEEHERKAREQH